MERIRTDIVLGVSYRCPVRVNERWSPVVELVVMVLCPGVLAHLPEIAFLPVSDIDRDELQPPVFVGQTLQCPNIYRGWSISFHVI